MRRPGRAATRRRSCVFREPQDGPRAPQRCRAASGVVLEDLEQCLAGGGTTTARSSTASTCSPQESSTSKGLRNGSVTSAATPIFRRLPDASSTRAATSARRCGPNFSPGRRKNCGERKQSQNVLAFRDLLNRLDDALTAPGGAELAAAIRGKYRAALIDEFQDTDPVQYSIFSRIYAGQRRAGRVHRRSEAGDLRFPRRGCFHLSEGRAARRQRQFTLDDQLALRKRVSLGRSIRSSIGPIPFLLDEIEFDPCHAEPKARTQQPLLFGGKTETPFRLWTRARTRTDLAK